MNRSSVLGGMTLELGVAFHARPQLTRLYHFDAVDRPMRVELEMVSHSLKPENLRPGDRVCLRNSGGTLFRGRLHEFACVLDVTGDVLRCAAVSDYHLCRVEYERVFFQVSDEDVVRLVAVDLGLVPVVDRLPDVRPSPIHRRVEVRGDPLAYVRAAAQRRGCAFAVAGGKLYFGERLPTLGGLMTVNGGRDVISYQLSSMRGGKTHGEMRVVGRMDWAPLRPFRLVGAVRGARGLFRALRVLHFVEASGHTTTVEFERLGDERYAQSA